MSRHPTTLSFLFFSEKFIWQYKSTRQIVLPTATNRHNRPKISKFFYLFKNISTFDRFTRSSEFQIECRSVELCKAKIGRKLSTMWRVEAFTGRKISTFGTRYCTRSKLKIVLINVIQKDYSMITIGHCNKIVRIIAIYFLVCACETKIFSVL